MPVIPLSNFKQAQAPPPEVPEDSTPKKGVTVPLSNFGTTQDSRLSVGGINGPIPNRAAEPEPVDMGRVVTENLPEIGATVGGVAGTPFGVSVPGAAIGGALGNAAKHEIKERVYGEAPQTGGEAALSMVGEGVKQAAYQKGGELLTEGAMKLGGLASRKLKELATGAKAVKEPVKEVAEKAAPAGFLPDMPQAPAGMAKPGTQSPYGFDAAPGYSASKPIYPGAGMPEHPAQESYKTALASHDAATINAKAAEEGVQATHSALTEALAGLDPHKGTFGTGEEVQSGLKNASDIWHREGGKLYDRASSMIGDLQVPSKPLRDVGDQILAGNNPTQEAFPNTGGFVSKVQGILDDITGLGDKVQFKALDGFRKKLIAIANDRTDTLAADQAKGIVTKLTGAITEAMEQGIGKDSPEAGAWKAARTFWKDGASIFDHEILTKAVNSNPEDVINMIRPGTGAASPSISEANRIRTGLLDYVLEHGTPEEVVQAQGTYNKFLNLFTEKSLLGGEGNVADLPAKVKGYSDVLDTLYGGTAEGRVVKENVLNLSNSVEKSMKAAGMVPDLPKVPKATPATPLPSKPAKPGAGDLAQIDSLSKVAADKKKLADQVIETAQKQAEKAKADRLANVKKGVTGEIASAKIAQDKKIADSIAVRAEAEKQMQSKIQKIHNVVRMGLITAVAGATTHSGIGGFAISGGTGMAAETALQKILTSKKATEYFTKGVEDIIARSGEKKVGKIATDAGANYTVPAWTTNFFKAVSAANDIKEDSKKPDLFGPLPTRK